MSKDLEECVNSSSLREREREKAVITIIIKKVEMELKALIKLKKNTLL